MSSYRYQAAGLRTMVRLAVDGHAVIDSPYTDVAESPSTSCARLVIQMDWEKGSNDQMNKHLDR